MDGDTPEGYSTVVASSSLPGTNPEDALLNSENPESYWSPDPLATDEPVLTVDITSETPATVTEIKLTVDDVLTVEVVINTPFGPYVPVNDIS